MSIEFEDDPEFNEVPGKPVVRRRSLLLEMACVVFILVLLAALLLPAVRSSGGASMRAQCTNNLKQIGLAFYNYEQTYGAFPPSYSVDANGRPLHSWRTLILPFLEQQSLYQSIDLSKPWNDPANAKALATEVFVYRCPAAKGPSNATSYLAAVGPDSCLTVGKPRRTTDVRDGAGATLTVIEVDDEHAAPWMAPMDADEWLFLRLRPDSKLHHPGGMNAGFVDGTVHFLKATVPADVRRALITVSGGERVSSDQY